MARAHSLVVAVAIAAVLAVHGCGEQAPEAAPQFVPTATVPATTDPIATTSAPAVTSPPTSPTTSTGPNETRPMEVSDGRATLAEMTQQADSVVSGTVTDVISLGRPDVAEDPHADEYIGITIDVSETLAGVAVDEVRLAWDAYLSDLDDNRVATIVSNGLRPPALGDGILVFMVVVDPALAEHHGGFPTHQPLLLDGVAYVRDGVVTEVESGPGAGQELIGRSIEDVASEVATAATG